MNRDTRLVIATIVIGGILVAAVVLGIPWLPGGETISSQWTTPVPQVHEGDVFTMSIGVSWDEYAQVAGLPSDWVFLLELELRKGGGGLVDSKQVLSLGCEGALEPGIGWCGEPAVVFWDTASLRPGDYEVFARLSWTDGDQVVYGHIEGEESHDGQYFQIFEKFQVIGETYLPLFLKRGQYK